MPIWIEPPSQLRNQRSTAKACAKQPPKLRARASWFHLPYGFEAQLFVAEPEIAKPLNMAWDTRGRLWITNTIGISLSAKAGNEPRDSDQDPEDTVGDGRADKVTTFADKLNIPMGLLPVRDGVICFNIPDIVLLKIPMVTIVQMNALRFWAF